MKKTLASLLVLILVLSCVSFAAAEGEPATIRFFPANAMAGSGELTGWNGSFFAEQGLIVEIVPFSSEKLQAILASGDLPDVVYLTQKDMLIAAESGMLLNIDEHLDKLPNVTSKAAFSANFEYARQYNSNGTGELYYLGEVSDNSVNVLADTDRNAIKMNWEIYAKAGYPEFSTLEEVIPVLKKMQEVCPTTADGIPTYGAHMFSDFDTNYFYNMSSVYTILGKSVTYLPYGIEYDERVKDGHSIFDDGSVYYRGLKFFYDMNKAGLIDPDSMAQTRSTAKAKIENSRAALAGWAANPGWEAWGYYPAVFDEFVPFYGGVPSYATGGYCISADTQNLDAALKFLDILANEELLLELRNGPEGLLWEYNDEGMPVLSEYYDEWIKSGSPKVSAENGENVEFWNIGYLLGNYYITQYGSTVCFANWPDMYEYQYTSPLALDWTQHYGYPYLKALIDDKNWEIATITEPYSAFLTVDDDDMVMTTAALKDIIVPASWQMIFANDEAQFETIWQDMKSKCESLGIDDVIQYKLDDIKQAREKSTALN